MDRIQINDLPEPKDQELTRQEQKDLAGGLSSGELATADSDGTQSGLYSFQTSTWLAGGDDLLIPCFGTGTLVRTRSGTVPIENVRAGDLVCAWDAERGVECLTRVRQAVVHEDETYPLLAIDLGDGDVVWVTFEHPVLTPRGWLPSAELPPGGTAVGLSGAIEFRAERTRRMTVQKVYHLVTDCGTFAVGRAGLVVSGEE